MPTSAIFCEHANEFPAVCRCPPDCYCQTHACRSRTPLPDEHEAQRWTNQHGMPRPTQDAAAVLGARAQGLALALRALLDAQPRCSHTTMIGGVVSACRRPATLFSVLFDTSHRLSCDGHAALHGGRASTLPAAEAIRHARRLVDGDHGDL